MKKYKSIDDYISERGLKIELKDAYIKYILKKKEKIK